MRKRVCKGIMELQYDKYVCNSCGKVIAKDKIKNSRRCSLNKKLNNDRKFKGDSSEEG